jgi:hypothetical protein
MSTHQAKVWALEKTAKTNLVGFQVLPEMSFFADYIQMRLSKSLGCIVFP